MQNKQSKLLYLALLSHSLNHFSHLTSHMCRTPGSPLWCFTVLHNAMFLSHSAVWSAEDHATGLWMISAARCLLQRSLYSIFCSTVMCLQMFAIFDLEKLRMLMLFAWKIFFSENSLPPLPGQTSAMGKLWFFILFFTWTGYFQKSSLFSLSFFSENMG